MKILLLEGVNATGVEILQNAGFQVETHAKSLPTALLREKIRNVHAIGIRLVVQGPIPRRSEPNEG
jgi:D-3-phosphoglycerate dehydrogenase